MKITVLCPFISDYLRYKNNEPITFQSINEMIKFFDEKNCALRDLRQFDFEIEDIK